MKDQYADLATDYDWLYADRQEAGDRQVRDAAPLLDTIEHPRILDCSCGTGIFALALARHGYETVGTDASPAMIGQATTHAAREALSLTLSVCAWHDLPQRFDPGFDLVFCGGNSIGHCQDETEMVDSLAAMRAVLKPGGRLIVETRDWEMLLEKRVRFTCFGPRERDGKRCVPLYVWNFGEEPGASVVVEVVLPIESDGRVALRTHRIVYHPFTLAQLTSRIRTAGFKDVQAEPGASGTVEVSARAP